jgi:hypothetical protein
VVACLSLRQRTATMMAASWKMSVGMLAGLLLGFLLCLGHHLFYDHLRGSPAPTGLYRIAGTDVSQQQLNIAAGTAFGFLVKSCLVTSISIAFSQAFWRAARLAHEGSTLSNLDDAYSSLSDLRSLIKPRVWRYFPLPTLLALIAW